MGVFSKILTAISAVLAIAGIVFVLTFFLLKLLWAWTIPDLFPAAIESVFGASKDKPLIAPEISWFTSFKLAIFLSVLGGFMKVKMNK